MIFPFEMRKRSNPVATYVLPVAGLPKNGPVFVPLLVHLINTLSPFAIISSCVSFRSGTGDSVTVTGKWLKDEGVNKDHNWNEIHPATKVVIK